MNVVEEITAAAQQAMERVAGSVVSLRGGGRGTGVVIATGRVATNAHNLSLRLNLRLPS